MRLSWVKIDIYLSMFLSVNMVLRYIFFFISSHLTGIDHMTKNRLKSKKTKPKKPLKERELCSGPSKLSQAMCITKDNSNMIDMTNNANFYVTDDGMSVKDEDVVTCRRIGVNGYGEDAANKLYRFYIRGSQHVSVIDKTVDKKS